MWTGKNDKYGRKNLFEIHENGLVWTGSKFILSISKLSGEQTAENSVLSVLFINIDYYYIAVSQ